MTNPSSPKHAIGIEGHRIDRDGKTVGKSGDLARHRHPEEGDLHLLLPGRRPRGRRHEGQAHRQLRHRGASVAGLGAERVGRRARTPAAPLPGDGQAQPPPGRADRAAGGAEHATRSAEAADGAPSPLRPDRRLREVALLVEEADYLHALYRWIVLTGEVPRAQDWLRREEWPHPDYVIDVFGSWEKFLQHAEITELAADRAAARGRRSERRRSPRASRSSSARLRASTTCAASSRPPSAAARRPTPSATTCARAPSAGRQLERAEARAADAEEHLAERRQQRRGGRRPTRRGVDEGSPRSRVLDELQAVRAHREELLRPGRGAARGRRAGRQDDRRPERDCSPRRRRAARPTAPPPRSRRPHRRWRPSSARPRRPSHLVFTDAAHDSAGDSPYRRPADDPRRAAQARRARRPLRRPRAASGARSRRPPTELGLTWRQNVSELARSRKPHDYTRHARRPAPGARPARRDRLGLGRGLHRAHLPPRRRRLRRRRRAGSTSGTSGRHLPDTTTA